MFDKWLVYSTKKIIFAIVIIVTSCRDKALPYLTTNKHDKQNKIEYNTTSSDKAVPYLYVVVR